MKENPRKTSHGFTLIELLVSMVITIIIVTVLVTVTVTSLDIWNRSRAEIRASLQAKAMIDSMAADFESMTVRPGNNFQWLFAEFAPPVDGPDNNDIDKKSPSALNLIFFSAATDRYEGQIGVDGVDVGGDISTIGYQLVYKDPIGDDTFDKFKTFALYRKIVDPKPTFDNLLGKADLKDAFVPYSSGGPDSVEAMPNFVCENVYQFTVKFHVDVVVEDPADPTKTITTPVTVTLKEDSSIPQHFIVTGSGLTINGTSAPSFNADVLAGGRLTAVEVSLTVLTDSAIKQLRGRTFTDPQKLSDFIAEHSFQYSKLIPVPSY